MQQDLIFHIKYIEKKDNKFAFKNHFYGKYLNNFIILIKQKLKFTIISKQMKIYVEHRLKYLSEICSINCLFCTSYQRKITKSK